MPTTKRAMKKARLIDEFRAVIGTASGGAYPPEPEAQNLSFTILDEAMPVSFDLETGGQ